MFGDSIGSNMFITGYALQKGFIPVLPESMEEAIKLNNIAVDMNLSAFRWGRMAAYDYNYVEKEAAPFMNNIEIDKDEYGINDIISDRTSFLENYQNKQYSDSYLSFVNKTINKKIP